MTNINKALATHGKISPNYLHLKKVGDIAGGYLIEEPKELAAKKVGKSSFGAQMEYRLRQEDGSLGIYTLPVTSHRVAIKDAEVAKPGDLLGFELVKIAPSKVKRGSKAYWISTRHIAQGQFKKFGIAG